MTTTTDAGVASDAHRNQLLHTLMSDHAKALVAYADKLLNDHHMAEDIVQETLIRAWSHAERLYSTEGSVRGWLLKVTRNLVVDRMRSAVARHETLGAHDRDLPLPDHAGAVLASVETTDLLRQLSHEHREVLLHTYLCGRTAQETARILGIPAGTVKSRQHYALNTLRAKAGRGLRRER
ncbi:ECF RNA polymerase sigma factor SigL [Streptomyces sp. MBT84]|jgi:RNA polymerase sigma-70 factor (ECF subfamily)|uniref:sigma-70 family RNA polymerase sigma factor n=1 Tax=unclassified Streptomyces TaxID=2593676 RepID=UPI000AD9AB69|nr:MULTISPECIES: sigma-70 family RNA polymerase sigma factor [unclassified Streptomyces]MBW8705796.1 ECF RNA polymerase sigma factor SigL [Streptomyces sp. MBT84]MDX3263166.1 sigma-70 family RNA polymerase sigma factor [Streptomyces sp. MI02-2A]REE58715.1 RNA polymerase sigma-70 factor (ECF subfamily) [Streptomyces sp. 3212.3]